MAASRSSAAVLFRHPQVQQYLFAMTREGSFMHLFATGRLLSANYVRFLVARSRLLSAKNRAYAHGLTQANTVEEKIIFRTLISAVLYEEQFYHKQFENIRALCGIDRKTIHVDLFVQVYIDFLDSLHVLPLHEMVAGLAAGNRLDATLCRKFIVDGLVSKGAPRYMQWFELHARDATQVRAAALESLLPTFLTKEIIDNYVEAMRLERDFFAAHAH
jgi:thiaminase/transcriptional activator TenA